MYPYEDYPKTRDFLDDHRTIIVLIALVIALVVAGLCWLARGRALPPPAPQQGHPGGGSLLP